MSQSPPRERLRAIQACLAPDADVMRRTLISRRDLGRALSSFLGAAAFDRCARAFEAASHELPAQGLIIRNERPINAEMPIDRELAQWLTPTSRFFVRSHFGPPAVGLRPWSIRVGGMVARAAAYSLEDLKPFEHVSLAAVLQCAGNGRAYFEPRIPGVPWERGAVGNARWGGVRLRDLLGAAGLERGVTHVHFYGGDPPPHPKTPAFVRSLPIERVLDPTTLLATTTNGEPLPILHGGPVRLVVPGWTGNHWIKWVRAIVASNEEAPGFYQRTAYRMPKTPVAPGTEVPPEDTSPVTWLNVKSLIALPAKGTRTLVRPLEIQGVAWTGQGRVERVEVGEDRGPWQTATLVGPDEPFAWRQWTFRWSALPGPEKLRGLRVRATDSRGNVQPERSPWNKSGYQWNGYDRVEVEVVA